MKFTSSVYVRDTIKLWLSCLLELLLFMPIWILVQVYILPDQVGSIGLFILPLLSLVGVMLRYYSNVKWKQLVLALLLGSTFGIITGSFGIASLPLAIAGFLCAYLGMISDLRIHISRIYWLGVATHFVATIIYHRIPLLEPFITLLTWTGSLGLILTLLTTNSIHLRNSSFSEENKPLPRGLQGHNRLYVIVIVLAGVGLAAGAGKTIGLVILNTIRLLFGWLFSGSGKPTPPIVDTSPPAISGFPRNRVSEPGLVATILNIVFFALAVLIVVVIVYYALRWLYRNAGGKWRRVIDAILTMLKSKRTTTENTGYLDEEKSVFTWEKTLKGIKDFWSIRYTPRIRPERWDQMNGERERVRWLYRKWIGMKRDKGYEVKSYLTPKETEQDVLKWAENRKSQRNSGETSVTATDHLIKMYDKVRYSEDEPSAADVAALKDQLKL